LGKVVVGKREKEKKTSRGTGCWFMRKTQTHGRTLGFWLATSVFGQRLASVRDATYPSLTSLVEVISRRTNRVQRGLRSVSMYS
jgi:hypothetical protein